jgi:SAM-dependent methyltransferase
VDENCLTAQFIQQSTIQWVPFMPYHLTISYRSKKRLLSVVLGIVVTLGARVASAQSSAAGPVLSPALHAAQILELSHYLAATEGAPDTYARVVKAAFASPPNSGVSITAFEENQNFVYAVGALPAQDGATSEGRVARTKSRWIRRLIVLNPSVLIIDDQLAPAISAATENGFLISQTAPQVAGRIARLIEDSDEISVEMLLPKTATYRVKCAENGPAPQNCLLAAIAPANSPATRFLFTLRVGKPASGGGAIQSKFIPATGEWKLTASSGGKVFRLTLPAPAEGAGEFAVASSDGKTLISSRPFPSGVLPHGREGNRLLALWDSQYQKAGSALWDIGRPADELQKVVAEHRVRQCRVVDMCCGSGSDAIYLARMGFDVTAIDVAPTALGQAQDKGRNAGVTVQWLLADILAPPDLKPFDFVYDRGCYHVVRDQNLPAYLETVRRFSHPGTELLLLATRRDEKDPPDAPGVTEEELRFDFLSLFDLDWLREIRLESTHAGTPGWSAFFKRNSK